MNVLLSCTLIFLMSISTSLQALNFTTQKWLTKNGTTVIFYQAMEVPMLTISLAFAAGSAYEGQQFGLSALTSELLHQGSENLDANTLAEKLADTGAQYDHETSRDMIVLNLKTLSNEEALKPAVTLFTSIISRPTFPKAAFNQAKNQQLMAIAQAEESAEDIANQVFFKKLYGSHPYAHPINGYKGSVQALTLKDINNFYKQYFVGKNAVLVLVGAINLERAQQLAEQLTEQLPAGQPAPMIPKAATLKKTEKIVVDFPSSQTMLRLGQIGIDHHNSDYFPLTVGNYILGGGVLVSKLAKEVRENRGLTYGIVSQFIPMPGDGPFLISFATQNKQATIALAVTTETLSAFLKEGVNAKELQEAKQYLIGSFPLSLSSNGSIASILLRMAFYHLPDDYLDTYIAHIKAVKIADIKNAFQKQLDPHKFLIVAVGKM